MLLCWINSLFVFGLFETFVEYNVNYRITPDLNFSRLHVWEQSNCRKPNCQAVCDSRLRLTSQMGCNCLINPMFVSFYAFYYGLFSLHAISSADLPSLGEGLCQKHFCCLATVTCPGMWSRSAVLSESSGSSHESDWSSIIFHARWPRRRSLPFHLSGGQLSVCVITAALLSPVQGLVKESSEE